METRIAKPGEVRCVDCNHGDMEDLFSLPIRRVIPVLWCHYYIRTGRCFPASRVAKHKTCDHATPRLGETMTRIERKDQ